MTLGSDLVTWLIAGTLIALLLVLGARGVRRLSTTAAGRQHWLLRALALLSPLCLVAGLLVAAAGPHLRGGPEPTLSPGLWMSALILMLVAALASPLLWRMQLQRHLGRPAGSLPFFQATRSALLVLFVLALVYLGLARRAAPELLHWLEGPGVLRAAAEVVRQLVHIAMLSAVIALPLMTLRALMIALARRIARASARAPRL